MSVDRRKSLKVLFLTKYPYEIASTRYRVNQFFPFLEENGIECSFSPLMNIKFFRILHKQGQILYKILGVAWFSLRRFLDVFRALRYDVVFVQREALMVGPPVVEWLIAKVIRRPVVFDFDDALFLGSDGRARERWIRMLKWPQKIVSILRLSSHVIVSTPYLQAYAAQYNPRVTVIPSVLDCQKFIPVRRDSREEITIGWVGTFSSWPYMERLRDVFEELGKRHRFVLKIVGLGRDYPLRSPNIEVINLDWDLEREVEDYQSLDIGVYPLIDDAWSRGKMGFKVIGYMAVGIPCVCSALGDHVRFLQDGVNGMLAATKEEWVEKLSRLIEDKELRRRIGEAARRTVEEWYCTARQAPRLREILTGAKTHIAHHEFAQAD